MSEGKGNTMVAAILLLSLLLQCGPARSANYLVGDSAGWDFNVAGWENGKSFKAGDTLVFNYDSNVHNVVVVNKSSFDSCSVPSNAKTYVSGNDQLILTKGANYFICGIPQHCQAGMKIAATAA
ncbi:hypothetical protein OROMI_008866 [Orobanche minor]